MPPLNNHVRRKGSFAPLSAHYYLDDSLAQAGEAAELLYVRGLAFCAATLSDGFISDAQLPRGPGVGMRDAEQRAKKLVEVGAWIRSDGGFIVRTWLNWNRSKQEILEAAETDRERKTRAGKGKPLPPGSQSDSERNPDGVQTDDEASHRVDETESKSRNGNGRSMQRSRIGNGGPRVTDPTPEQGSRPNGLGDDSTCEDYETSERNPEGIRSASGTTRARLSTYTYNSNSISTDSSGDVESERSTWVAAATEQPPPPDGARRRATRIPEDFSVDASMVDWAREHAPHVDGRIETEQFRDYWQAKSGKDATKLDWPATWRTWMRREEQKAGRGTSRSSGTSRTDDWQALKRTGTDSHPPLRALPGGASC